MLKVIHKNEPSKEALERLGKWLVEVAIRKAREQANQAPKKS